MQSNNHYYFVRMEEKPTPDQKPDTQPDKGSDRSDIKVRDNIMVPGGDLEGGKIERGPRN